VSCAYRPSAAPLVFISPFCETRASDPAVPRPAAPTTVFFGSLDAGYSTFGSLGVKRTLQGSLDESGLVGMAGIGYGGTVERVWREPEGSVIRHALQGSALLGYQWVRDGLVIAAFAGPEIEGEELGRFTLSGAEGHLGARLHGELWAHPTMNTLLTATVIGGTTRTPHLWSRASAGYALWDGVFVGPEASVYTTDTYREWRFGGHVTGVSVGGFSLRLSGGWRGEEESGHQGAYFGLSAHVRR
jgi:hypothetical protein